MTKPKVVKLGSPATDSTYWAVVYSYRGAERMQYPFCTFRLALHFALGRADREALER